MNQRFVGKSWSVLVSDHSVVVTRKQTGIVFDLPVAGELLLRRGWRGWFLQAANGSKARIGHVRRSERANLRRALRSLQFADEVAAVLDWSNEANRCLNQHIDARRWIAREVIEEMSSANPSVRILEKVKNASCDTVFSCDEQWAMKFAGANLELIANEVNQWISATELQEQQDFLATIEKSPLTDEQARAVVCFDNRVQVLAAAGSGKTSVMVARAAYAIKKEIVTPGKVLVLAFNKAASVELQQRIRTRLGASGIDDSGLMASTFHSFGLSLIGQATGRKPRLAPFVEAGREDQAVLGLVDELSDASADFRYKWDLYRMLFANAPTNLEFDEPDGYDKSEHRLGYETLSGIIVKSHGERLIADFLFLNGVKFEYERDFPFDTTDAQHSQYRPDFYYPDIDVWHEHWAVDPMGRAPSSFAGYEESMVWKRSLHAHHGTTLIESTWGGVMFFDGLSRLKEELEGRGLVFDWNPDRPVENRWLRPQDHESLCRFIRTFMTHVKANGLDEDDIEHRLNDSHEHLSSTRTRLFLAVYWTVHQAWEARLQELGCIDFDDMLIQAAEILESGRYDPGFELVLVDEFQDASRSRARLVRGLVDRPHRYLMAVGDDWQSINRFAGSDMSVMHEFTEWFGAGPQLRLTRTFRCAQSICDVASEFIMRNPDQFEKAMNSVHIDEGDGLSIVQTSEPMKAINAHLQQLSKYVAAGRLPNGAMSASVDILGRYRFLQDVMPATTPPNLNVSFRTVHGSKGLEADYVIIPGMQSGRYGFPAGLIDDQVLELAMPKSETFEHAEERRLFYVALTRARWGVLLVAPENGYSPFVLELLTARAFRGRVGDDVVYPPPTPPEPCRGCGRGVMVARKGLYGNFFGCSTYPKCRHTQQTLTRDRSDGLARDGFKYQPR